MRATFSNSVDVLVRAYFDGTLEHTECHACAAGNLVAHGKGIKIVKDLFIGCSWEKGQPHYFDVMMLGIVSRDRRTQKTIQMAEEDAAATGYTLEELARIEYAFESAPGPEDCDSFNDEWMFNGLMAVVDVLADIHGVDLSTKQSAVTRFEEIHAVK